jgi:putative endonuclease
MGSAEHLRLGQESERAARDFLIAKGCRFIAANYRSPYGEIDLIMTEDDTLLFVEVRYRKSDHYGGSAESVTANKQGKIRKTAEHYLQRVKNPRFEQCRFDVLAISGIAPDWRIDWICDAFE